MKNFTEKIYIRRFEQDVLADFEDIILIENPIELFLNGSLFSRLTCTGDDVKSLVVGHLFCESAIKSPDEVLDISICNGAHSKITSVYIKTSGLEIPKQTDTAMCVSPLVLDYSLVVKVFEKFQERSPLFKKTGAVHSAALLDTDYRFCYFCEDMGRHNAVDTVIGKALLGDFSLSQAILITSSRMPLELMQKARRAQIPAVFSISAPTLQSILFARENNMALVGMFRNNRINIYN